MLARVVAGIALARVGFPRDRGRGSCPIPPPVSVAPLGHHAGVAKSEPAVPKTLSQKSAIGLLDDLADLAATGALDLMDLDRAGPVARERALVGCVPLYEREAGGFARRQMAAMLERMDTDWLRRLDLEAMSG